MRRALVLLGCLLVLAAATGLLALRMVPEDALRARFVAEVERSLGRPAIVTGRTTLALWPWPTVTVDSVGLEGEGPDVAVSQVQAELAPLAWLFGGRPVRALHLRRPRVTLTAEDAMGLATVLALDGDTPPIAVVDGRIRVLGADGQGALLSDIAATGRAAPDGGYAVDGNGLLEGEAVAFTLSLNRQGRLSDGSGVPVAITVAAAPGQGRFVGTVAAEGAGEMVGDIELSTPSVGRLIAWLSLPALPERLTPGRATLSGGIRHLPGRLDLEDVTFEADALAGSADLSLDLADGSPHVAGRIALDRLTDEQIATAFEGVDWQATVDLGLFAAVDADVELRIAELTAGQLALAGVQAHAIKSGDQINLSVAPIDMAGGEVSLSGAVDAGRIPPAFAVDVRVAGLAMAPVWDALAPRVGITGEVTARLTATARAHSVAEALVGLSGEGTIAIADGRIAGIDMATGASGRLLDTPFQLFEATIAAADGVISLRDARLQAGEQTLVGYGQIDLPAQRVSAEMTAPSSRSPTTVLRLEGPIEAPRLFWHTPMPEEEQPPLPDGQEDPPMPVEDPD
ncbi:MAG: AsmA family protein [Rhodospirillaceae bacterium]|nr:AsmA family protein [Rhodospirillaceae bacterium]